METYNIATLTKALYDARIALFTIKTLRDLFGPDIRSSTFFSLLARLEQSGVLRKLERNKYLLEGKAVHDFTIANFLYEPSYISLETALNFHGILSQFPYEISSVTVKKPVKKTVDNKTFRYVQIKRELFWGYDATPGFLIAQPEKALLDLLYIQTKGIAVAHLDEYDLSRVDKDLFDLYKKRFPTMRDGTYL